MSILEQLPTPLLYSLAATTLCLLLTGLACGFVWWAMDTDGPEQPDVRPAVVLPGPPVPR